MKTKIRFKKGFLISITIITVVIIFGFIYRKQIHELFPSGREKAACSVVDRALKLHKSFNSPDQNLNKMNSTKLYDKKPLDSLYSQEYLNAFYYLDLFESNTFKFKPHYNIIEWKLLPQKKTDGTFNIMVHGIALSHLFNEKKEITTTFIVEKIKREWKITNSYNYFSFDAIKDSANHSKSDLFKVKLINDLKKKIELVNCKYKTVKVHRILSSDMPITVYAECIIVNNSSIPIYSANVVIKYKDKYGNFLFFHHWQLNENEIIYPNQQKEIKLHEANYYELISKYEGDGTDIIAVPVLYIEDFSSVWAWY